MMARTDQIIQGGMAEPLSHGAPRDARQSLQNRYKTKGIERTIKGLRASAAERFA